jgi:hypothetical protein
MGLSGIKTTENVLNAKKDPMPYPAGMGARENSTEAQMGTIKSIFPKTDRF